MKNKKNDSSVVALTVIGAGLAGLAATAYFFLGPKATKNQKNAKAWALKMKADVVEKLENAKNVSEPIYKEIIDSVAKNYEKNKKASNNEIEELASDLKKHWKTISGGLKTVKTDVVKSVKKATKRLK